MSQISDTAQTRAVVAAVADGPTRVTGIGFIRGKETDRVGAVVTELRRAGIDASEEADGFVIQPGRPQPALIETYDDHRMAMSFALLGLTAAGIRRSEEHTSELQSLTRNSYDVFCMQKKTNSKRYTY